ncbi:uncharacterized protein JCM15063_001306 [Sporobolomyces koalae]|uniref:uncharacterized protein n=1 Tax=Sporobolomyces koalae TaxID=500713 RepID=UPI003182B885
MPSFAELRAKAEAAASTAKEKSHALTSSSSKYTPTRPPLSSGSSAHSSATRSTPPTPRPTGDAPPPRLPPPSRTASTTSLGAHEIRPASRLAATPVTATPLGLHPAAPTAQNAAKPFSRYDERDKASMFAALDLFFNSRLSVQATETDSKREVDQVQVTRPRTLAPKESIPLGLERVLPLPAAPTAPLATRPQTAVPSTPSSSTVSLPSYPPREDPYSCAALALSDWIESHPFSTPWFTDPANPMPPPLQRRSDHQSSFSWQQRNSSKQFVGMTLFGDASAAWYRISWDVTLDPDPNRLLDSLRREARYRPRPSPWDGARLYHAHELYGPRIAQFARHAVSNQGPIARGECWDLAHEALKTVANELDHSNLKPFVSIGRTHGQLLYWANAQDPSHGQWFGGELYVREGDIVEWRSVTIREAGAPNGSYSILGDPDHTAIIVGTGSPTSLPEPSPSLSDPAPYAPSSLTCLTVVEQSLGQIPTARTYDLSHFSKGEIWIYRPCGMSELVGFDRVEAKWPSLGDHGTGGIETWQVGDLE